MSSDSEFSITYWGTTGSMTAPLRPEQVTDKLVWAVQELARKGRLGALTEAADDEARVRAELERHLPFHLRSTYGGNTTCIEIGTSDALLILDAGSGFRELGIDLARRWGAADFDGDRVAHVLLTHSHMDHTYGTPFVEPYYDPRNDFSIWATQFVIDHLAVVLEPGGALAGTFFPPALDLMVGVRRFRPLEAGGEFKIGTTRIRTHALNHPGGSLAYRLERDGRAVVFAHDHEHTVVPDPDLVEFARGADLLYMDAQYLEGEYRGTEGIMGDPPASRIGWGHSSVEACVATAAAAGVRRVDLGHREPKRSDEDMARIEHYGQELMRETLRKTGRDADAIPVRIATEGLRFGI